MRPQKLGTAEIKIITVSKEDSSFTHISAMKYGRGFVPPGKYAQLLVNGAMWMSDTPDEIRNARIPLACATGRVLINGLGLGCVLAGLLSKESVTHIDVVEINPDVMTLVGPYFKDPRVKFHLADAFTIQWRKGVSWDYAWHDIWLNICGDNASEMTRLRRKYARRVDGQSCWCENETRRHNRESW